MKRKIFGFVLVLSMIVSLLPGINAAAAETSGACGSNVTWTYQKDTRTLTIDGEGSMEEYSSSSSVPWHSYAPDIKSVVFSGQITTIANSAFSDCSALKSIHIPESITEIGDNAFTNCYDLSSITIPNGVMRIGNFAFSWCYSLTELTIPDKLVDVNAKAFYESGLRSVYTNDSNINYVSMDGILFNKEKTLLVWYSNNREEHAYTIPNSVKDIGDSAFFKCMGLTEIIIPDSVVRIGNSAFWGCSGLTELTLPDGVASIENEAFSGCTELAEVTLSKKLEQIGMYAFEADGKITEIVMPDSVTRIEERAFSGCAGLKNITLSKKLEYIGAYAFSGCGKITEIVIPDSVMTVERKAFDDCAFLTRILFDGNAPVCDATAFDNINSSAIIYYIEGKTGFGSTFCGITTKGIQKIFVEASVESGSVPKNTALELISNSNSIIYYTTDGTTPTEESDIYQGQIIIDRPMTIKAIAVTSEEGYLSSDVAVFTYRISDCELTGIDSLEDVTIDGTSIVYSTADEILHISAQVSDFAAYGVYSDENCTNKIDHAVVLSQGDNTIYIKVTAEDEVTSKVYTMNVYRVGTGCEITGVTFPENAQVKENKLFCSVNTDKLTPVLQVSSGAEYAVYLDENCANQVDSISLDYGDNIAYVKVAAEDGSASKVYTMTIHRNYDSAVLSSVKLQSDEQLFDMAEADFIELEYPIASVQILPETKENASYKLYRDMDGQNELTGAYELFVGDNTVYIEVVSESGLNKEQYSIHIRRKDVALCPQIKIMYNDEVNDYLYVKPNSLVTFYHELYDKPENETEYTIYYTTDGTEPTQNSMVYDGESLVIAEDTLIKAFVRVDGMTDSDTITYPIRIAKEILLTAVATTDTTITFDLQDAKTGNRAVLTGMDSAALEYAILRSEDTHMQWQELKLEFPITSETSQIVVTGLPPHSKYLFRLCVKNGEYNGISAIVEASTALSAMTDIIVFNSPNGCRWSEDKKTITAANVMNAVTETVVDLIVSEGAVYQLYKDKLCKTAYIDNSMPLKIGENTAYIKVIAEDGWTNTVYTLKVTRQDKVEAPQINSPDGYMEPGKMVEISTKTQGASIRYTLDGTRPSQTNGILYEQPIPITGDYMEIQAIAYKTGMEDSNMVSFQVAMSNPVDNLTCVSTTDTSAELIFRYPEDAQKVQIFYSMDKETWNEAALETTLEGGIVKNLRPQTTYYFKINVIGGMNCGYSNITTGITKEGKKIPEYSVPVLPPVEYSPNLMLSDIMLPEGWSWRNGETSLVAGTHHYMAIYNNGDPQYISIEERIVLTVDKTDPEVNVPLIHSVPYHDGITLEEISLPDRWEWQNADELLQTGENTVRIIYTPSDTDNYNILIKEIVLLVYDLEEKPMTAEIVYNNGVASVYSEIKIENAVIVFAEYDSENVLKSAQIQPVSISENDTVEIPMNGQPNKENTVRVMLWDGFMGMHPLSPLAK